MPCASECAGFTTFFSTVSKHANNVFPCLQAVLLQCLDALCQYSEQIASHYRAVTTHLLPALATAVGRPGESKDSKFLCLKLLCDVILHILLETNLYEAQQEGAPTSGES